MHNDLYYTLAQISKYIKKIDEKVKQLEKENKELQEKLDIFEKNPPVNIERIDYHFDQLKIERLEGTLNIGINPANLNEMDEFTVNSTPVTPPPKPNYTPALLETIQTRANAYIDEKLESIIDEAKNAYGVNADQSYTILITQDIRKQIHGRIEYYLQKAYQSGARINEEQLAEQIFQSITKDIQQAVHAFFSQFPMRGEEDNDF